MIKLAAFIGCAGSGKTTVAQATGYTQIAFAHELKIVAAEAIGTHPEVIEARKAEFRKLLVAIGRSARIINPNVWINHVDYQYSIWKVHGHVSHIALSDVRYVNECEWVLARGGKLFYIKREGVGPDNEEERRSIAAIQDSDIWQHVTVIHNDSTPQSAAAKVLEGMK